MEAAILFVCALLLAGLVLRARIGLLQICYVPAAILGGILGLVILQIGTSAGDERAAETAEQLIAELRSWPGWLIAVVFAGLFLDKPAKRMSTVFGGAAKEGNVVWIIGLGQVAFGLLAVALIIDPLRLSPFDGKTPIYFGQLIEAGFIGGHGTSAALGDVYAKMDYPDAKDLAFFMATIGMIYSVLSGMVFVNLAVRRGWTQSSDVRIEQRSGFEARHRSDPIGRAKVDSSVLDPLVFQVLILAGAFAAGLGLQWLAGLIYDGLPLFMFTLIGGWIVRDAMRLLGVGDLIDPDTIRRITAAAMEFLIVAAIASLNLSLVAQTIVPLSILLVVAFVWTAVCLLYVGRRLLPADHWFELGIINYGMSTGVTASGLMLLRIVDRDFQSGAAEDYAMAAPLSSPFIGGGILTVVAFPHMLRTLGIAATGFLALAATVVLFVLGLLANRRSK